MKIGQYIYIKDGIGELIGNIVHIYSTDFIEVDILSFNIKGEWKVYSNMITDNLFEERFVNIDLKKCTTILLYNNYEEILENYFECFL